MTEPEKHYRRTDAAKYVTDTYGLPCSPKTLAKIACVSSDGPRFRLAGRFPLYPQSELDKWAQAKIGPMVRSNAEAVTAKTSAEKVQRVMEAFDASMKKYPMKFTYDGRKADPVG